MNTMNKALFVIVIMLLLVSLAGCLGAGDDTSTRTTTTETDNSRTWTQDATQDQDTHQLCIGVANVGSCNAAQSAANGTPLVSENAELLTISSQFCGGIFLIWILMMCWMAFAASSMHRGG